MSAHRQASQYRTRSSTRKIAPDVTRRTPAWSGIRVLYACVYGPTPGPSGVTRGGERGGTAPGDTLQGVTPERKKFVGEFTENSG